MANKSQKRLNTARRKSWQTTLQISAANKNLGEQRLIGAVIDANVWISAILFGGKSEAVLRFCLAKVEIIASEVLADEVFDYFKYQTEAPQKWRRFFRLTFEKICTIIPLGETVEGPARDIKDNHVIAAALAGKCRFIITGDKDLLELDNYRGVKILSPADFLKLVKQD